jgi:Zinc knuckle
MSSKISPRIRLPALSDSLQFPSLTAAIWPESTKIAYASSLIRRFGHTSRTPAASYAKVASLPPGHKALVQFNPTRDTSSQGILGRFNAQRENQFRFRRNDWVRNRYFRCGEKGHRAAGCRNARVCFVCGGIGHISSSCNRSSSSSASTTKSSSDPQCSTMAAFPLVAPSHIHRVWLSDESSAKLAEEVQQSLILIGDKDIMLFEVLDGL